METLLHKLETIGQAMYGPLWQSAVARDLGVADRTVRRWVAGTSSIPPGILGELKAVCLRRSAELAELAGQIDAG